MPRWVLLLAFAGVLSAPAAEQKKQADPKPQQQEQEPPEEDEAAKPKVYAFNPLQATREVQVGNYYFKKGSMNAAAMRFREATRWNPGMAEAWLRLGETEERRKDIKAAREAYAKYVELEADSKRAGEVRKKLEKLHCQLYRQFRELHLFQVELP